MGLHKSSQDLSSSCALKCLGSSRFCSGPLLATCMRSLGNSSQCGLSSCHWACTMGPWFHQGVLQLNHSSLNLGIAGKRVLQWRRCSLLKRLTRNKPWISFGTGQSLRLDAKHLQRWIDSLHHYTGPAFPSLKYQKSSSPSHHPKLADSKSPAPQPPAANSWCVKWFTSSNSWIKEFYLIEITQCNTVIIIEIAPSKLKVTKAFNFNHMNYCNNKTN